MSICGVAAELPDFTPRLHLDFGQIVSREVGVDPLFLFLWFCCFYGHGARPLVKPLSHHAIISPSPSTERSPLMAHPLIPQIIELAEPVATALGLEVVGAVFHTNQHPPILRIDIRNLEQDTGLDDCEQMSRALEPVLDATNVLPDAYVLEVSSPGTSRALTTDREFVAFKGFSIIILTSEAYAGQQEWTGQLIRRDEEAIHLNQKGRAIAIPRPLIAKVYLDERR
jgi:ribosome maturation factor RimP